MPNSRTDIIDLALTVKLAGTVVAATFVAGPTGAATTSAAAGNALGVAQSAGVSGDYISVATQGIVQVLSGGAIADNALVDCDAQGRAVTHAAGVVLGRVVGSVATAAGQIIQINLFNN